MADVAASSSSASACSTASSTRVVDAADVETTVAYSKI
jgi:hypothetical protein